MIKNDELNPKQDDENCNGYPGCETDVTSVIRCIRSRPRHSRIIVAGRGVAALRGNVGAVPRPPSHNVSDKDWGRCFGDDGILDGLHGHEGRVLC